MIMLTRPSHRSRKPVSRKTHRATRKQMGRKILFEQLENRLLLAANPTIRIDDVQQAEGDSGNASFVFTVTRSGKTNQPSTIDYVVTSTGTPSGTATEGEAGISRLG